MTNTHKHTYIKMNVISKLKPTVPYSKILYSGLSEPFSSMLQNYTVGVPPPPSRRKELCIPRKNSFPIMPYS